MGNLRDDLLDLIDNEAFDPVLQASPDDYDGDDQAKLRDAQATTRSTQQRYHDRQDAEGVRDEFKGDLSSDAADQVQSELRSLGLPTLEDIEGDFERMYRDRRNEG